MDLHKAICSRLDKAVKARNVTPAEVSRKAGFPPAYLANAIRRQSCPRTDRLMKIADVMGISLDWLVEGAGHMFREDRRRTLIATQMLKAMDAGLTDGGEIIASVQDRLASYAVTDDEIQGAAQWIADLWRERKDAEVSHEAP